MRPLQTSELAALRSAAAETLFDTCIVQTYTESAADAFGAASASYVDGAAQPCGFKTNGTRELHQDGEVVTIDATMRLAIDATIAATSRVQLTHRHGEELAVKPVFSVIGEPVRGVSAIVVKLSKVTE